MSELSPDVVSARLEHLRALYVPETIEEGRARLARERVVDQPFAQAVERRLTELRALCDLARHLHNQS